MPDEHPYGDDDGEESGAAANARLVQDMRQDMTGADEDQSTQVEIGAPVHEEPDDDEPRGNRRQRRSERGRNHRLQANDDRDAARAEAAKLREEMAEMRGHMAGMRQSQQQQPADPFEAERSKVLTAQKETQKGYRAAMLNHFNSKTEMSEADEEAWQRRSNAHTEELGAVGARQEMARVDSPEARQHADLVAKYPEVMRDDKARNYAISTYQAQQALGEIPAGHSPKDVARIMKDTARRFRLNGEGSPEPTDQQNSSYGRGGRSGTPAAPRRGQSVNVGPAERRMAMQFYRHRGDMSTAQKLQAFVNMQHDGDDNDDDGYD